jgi:small subunit ribosomal protein S4
LGPKCAVERRSYPPGEQGRKAAMRRKVSDYGMQLREKQKARRIYGVLERQFRRYFEEATRRKGLTGETLLTLLESRLDNVVYRLGFSDSRPQARQLVRHGHFSVNGQKTDVPSYIVMPGDVISVQNSSRSLDYFKERLELLSGANPPTWLRLDVANLSGTLLSEPNREEISIPLREQLIVEYYSR